jgi:hypothetical protein
MAEQQGTSCGWSLLFAATSLRSKAHPLAIVRAQLLRLFRRDCEHLNKWNSTHRDRKPFTRLELIDEFLQICPDLFYIYGSHRARPYKGSDFRANSAMDLTTQTQNRLPNREAAQFVAFCEADSLLRPNRQLLHLAVAP